VSPSFCRPIGNETGTRLLREHQIRRSRHIVQARPLRSLCWADIPQLSTRDRRCPAAWQQYWQQSRRNGLDPRPSAFQAGHIPKSPFACERVAVSPFAVTCHWLLLLLSRLLSAQALHGGSLFPLETSR
jgi:hypothetical protein